MPSPKQGENKDDFISRCMSSAEAKRTAPEQDHRFALCNGLWEGRKTNNMEQVTVNFSGTIQKKEMNGKQYLVAPMSLISPGVLNGSKGPLYYPPDEIMKSVDAWNGVPIVVYHPTMEGSALSARDPEVLNNQGIGFVFHTRYDKKLVAEGWFDIEAMERIDNRVLDSLNSGTEIELSTGLFTENEKAMEGAVTDNGKTYEFIARNYRPDHLAILPDQIGACSISDGCGVLVNQEKEQEVWTYQTEDHTFNVHFDPVENEVSHSDLHEMLTRELKSRFKQDEPSAWISEVFDKYIVYWQGDELFKLGYSKTKNEVTLSSESPEKVVKETSFVTVANKKEISDMAKEQIDQLIENCSCWTEEDREILNNMPEEKIESLLEAASKHKETEAVANAATKEFTVEGGNAYVFNSKESKWELKNKEGAPLTNQTNKEEKKTQTEEEWLAAAPNGIRAVVENAMNFEAKRRKELCEQIVSNEEDNEAKQAMHIDLDLDNLSIAGLERLASRLGKQKQEEAIQNRFAPPSYFGSQGASPAPVANKKKKKSDPLVPPTINWEEAAKELSNNR